MQKLVTNIAKLKTETVGKKNFPTTLFYQIVSWIFEKSGVQVN